MKGTMILHPQHRQLRVLERNTSMVVVVLGCCAVMACEPNAGETYIHDANTVETVPQVQGCSPAVEPACVSACGMGASVPATCQDSTWRCDGGVNVAYCPDFADDCDANSPCGAGYTCVDSVTYPVPVDTGAGICRKGAITRRPDIEACRPDGTLTAAKFISSHSQNVGQIIKVAGELKVQMTCSNFACAEHDPCCNTCLGNYMIELRDPHNDKLWADLLIDVGAPGCSGTTCETSCGSLQPGDTYTIWGVLDGCQGLHKCTMLVMGSCPL